ncbi:MAG: hypothetical protein P1U74_02125 [Legionellaceae bacterium]|nr:hypothetical protein [Legionellaceae bacterium]
MTFFYKDSNDHKGGMTMKSQQEQREQATALYQQPHLNERQRQELFAALEQLSSEVLTAFINEQETALFESLAQGSIFSLENTSTPWTAKDMNAYYELRPDDDDLRLALHERRHAIIANNPITIHDNLQLSRNKITKPALEERVRFQFHQLESLSHARAILNPEKNAKEYCFDYLFSLLTHYRTQLQLACDAQKDESTPAVDHSELIIKMDWITHYFAQYFNQVIQDKQIDQHSADLKSLLTQLGELSEEIFPWLSIMFRHGLLQSNVDENVIDEHIESFLAFHSLLQEKSVGEMIYNISGGSIKPYIKQALKQELITWEGIQTADLDKKIRNVKFYLQQSELSSWVVTQISQDLLTIAQSSLNEHPDLPFVLYLLAERARCERYVFQEAYQLFFDSSIDLVTNTGVLVSRLAQTKLDQAVTLALVKGFLPPSAQLLYLMLEKDRERTLVLIADLAENNLPTLKETLHIIFSDDDFALQHQLFLDSNPHPLVTHEHYPLFVLRQAYDAESAPNNEQLIALWLKFIDSETMTHASFLAKEMNQQLFANLALLKDQIQTISLTHHQIKALCTALALYRATQLNLSALNRSLSGFAMLLGPSKIAYKDSSQWAEELLYNLLKQVAYPQNSTEMDFDNVVRFLDIEFNAPPENSIPLEVFQEHMLKDINTFLAANRHINLSFQDKFLHVFIQLFKTQNIDINKTPIHVGTLLSELPTLCSHLFDLMSVTNYVAMPAWFSLALQSKVTSVMLSSALEQEIMSAFAAPHIQYLESLQDEADESETQQFNAMMSRNSIFASIYNNQLSPRVIEQNKRRMGYFVKQIYMAYCNHHLQHDGSRSLNKMIQREANREALQKDAQPIVARMEAMEKSLIAHNKIARSYSYSWWWQWVGYIIGYDFQESKTQLEHFKTIKSYANQNDIRALYACQNLLQQVESAVTQETFKRSFWLTSFYHNELTQLQVELSSLKTKIIAATEAAIPTTIAEHEPVEDPTINTTRAQSTWVKDRKEVQASSVNTTLYPAGTREIAENSSSHSAVPHYCHSVH